jgi:hypothetical protein
MPICPRCKDSDVETEGMRYCDRCRRLCAKCGVNYKGSRSAYCNSCHAANSRANRKPYTEWSEEQKHKARARAYAHSHLRRGKISRKGCQVCGAPAEMHHADYNWPLRITWLCRRHHVYLHHPLPNQEPQDQ